MKAGISNFSSVDLDNPPSIEDSSLKVHYPELVIADETNISVYGELVDLYEDAEVEIVAWPQQGWRSLVPGTGIEAGLAEDLFEMKREGDLLYANNLAVNRCYLTGWYSDPAFASENEKSESAKFIYTHEANYHPDGGQLFFPRDGEPFLALLAKPGDDIRPEYFKCYYFDGSAGLNIHPGVWHQPLFPLGDSMVFQNKQNKVHACVSVDLVNEFNCYLALPLDSLKSL